ncbi:TetR/AcrR family transcriptional regulator [Patulibacter sp.]|uniref:TetR/AcrR family transcriptional regulator n=1 Tax=Patulibacter sp. TaxID=1912859 RepID=UPI002718C7BC|nr:TetR/AcrR family transcriptional regulator [Patulibacter sp.]MDO9409275.1 helix-turn-helix domain-containing protein [Patulibacter sp.]
MSSVLSRRSSGPDDQRGRTRAKILDATVGLLGEGRAFAELSVGELSSRAGVSRPTFYAYFQDKRDLVLALGSGFEADARRAASPWLRTDTDDIGATLTGVLAAFAAHRATVGALVEAATYDAEVAAFWRAFHDWFIVNATERARRADPGLAAEDAEALAYGLVWMTERSFTEHLGAPRVSDDALLRAVERLWRTVVPAD